MKLHKLTIHNIASIEDAVIDFDAEPLCSSDVFLITGKTGSGKSTILDSICLALYGSTPRFENNLMQGKSNEVQVNNPGQILRRNTGECFVRLEFTGNNNVRYEAQWSIKRARNNPSGKLQGREWSVKNLANGYTLSKNTDVSNEIQSAVGLDFNQFCRTTMLAQGEFTKFLNSKDEEKANILEKITGVDIYSKIGAKIFQLTKEKENVWREAEALIGQQKTLTDEEIENENKRIASLDSLIAQLSGEKSAFEDKKNWIDRQDELQKNLDKACAELNTLLQEIESQEFKADEALVNDWKTSGNARKYYREILDSQKRIGDIDNSLKAASGRFELLCKYHKRIKDEIADLKNGIREIDSYLEKEKDNASVYERVQTIETQLNTYISLVGSIGTISEKIQTDQQKLDGELKDNLIKAEQNLENKNSELKSVENEIKCRQDKYDEMNVGKLREEKDKLLVEAGDIETARQQINHLEDTLKRRRSDMENLRSREKEIVKLEEEIAACCEPLHNAKVAKEQAYNELSACRDSVDKFAVALRAKLERGNTCPVCGQIIESCLPNEEELSSFYKEAEEKHAKAETELEDLKKKDTQLRSILQTSRESYTANKASFDNDTTVEENSARAESACRAFGIELNINESLEFDKGLIINELNRLYGECESKKNALEAKLKDAAFLESEIKDFREKESGLRKELKAMEADVEKHKEDYKQCEKSLYANKQLLESSIQNKEAISQTLSGLLDNYKNGLDWREETQAFLQDVKDAAASYEDNKSSKNKFESRLQTIDAADKSVEANVASILGAISSWNMILYNEYDVTDELNQDIDFDQIVSLSKNLWDDVNVNVNQKSAEEQKLEEYRRQYEILISNGVFTEERIAELSDFSSEQILEKESLISDTGKKKAVAESNRRKAEEDLSEHMKKCSEAADRDYILQRINALGDEINKNTEERGGILERLRNDAANKEKLGQLISERDIKKSEYDKWQSLNSMLGDSEGKTFRKIAQSYVLSSLIHAANHYMRTLSKRYELKVEPGSFVVSVVDAYQAYATRAASTISGGESFLVSLSLSLALSDIGGQLQTDTIFIDEGFGTLSGESLEQAIDTLRSLQSRSGRHVGIISHVQELKERISVQIQVNQEGHNSSSTIQVTGS